MSLEEAKESTMNNIIDLNIESAKKTQIRINGRNDSILELDLSDMGIAERLEAGYEKLQAVMKKVAELDTEDLNLTKALKTADNEMRVIIDEIFDSNVSEVCCKTGTMFDINNGIYKFESIIEGLTKLYANNLNAEYKAMKRRVQQNADKYIGPQDHKKSVKKRKEITQKEDE